MGGGHYLLACPAVVVFATKRAPIISLPLQWIMGLFLFFVFALKKPDTEVTSIAKDSTTVRD